MFARIDTAWANTSENRLLCSKAATTYGTKAIWKRDPASEVFVKRAKNLKLDCTNPATIETDESVCKKSVMLKTGNDYEKEIIRRGIDCKLWVKTNNEIVRGLSDQKLCESAYLESNIHKAEILKRGLECDDTVSAKKPAPNKKPAPDTSDNQPPPIIAQKPKQPPKPEEPTLPEVQNEEDVKRASSGSGFAVSSAGHIITNHHVINGCSKIFVHYDGKAIPTDIITFDQKNDLALLKGSFTPDAIFSLSNKGAELLQEIYVAGYPFGWNYSTSVKVTKGIISSLTGIGNNFSEIQIDAALQKGNSGGPILDEYGNIVGVAVSKLDTQYAIKNFGAIPENINFGVKANVVKSLLESQSINAPLATNETKSLSELGKKIRNGTYYISCWMTVAQIEAMRSKKVMFDDIK